MRESGFYVSALEKENHFLREEIERSKYSKSKEEYGKFVSGLTQLKKKPTTLFSTTANDENTRPVMAAAVIQNVVESPQVVVMPTAFRTPFKDNNNIF